MASQNYDSLPSTWETYADPEIFARVDPKILNDTKVSISNQYKKIFGVDPTQRDVDTWAANFLRSTQGKSVTPLAINQGMTNSAKELMVGVGKPPLTAEEQAATTTGWIKDLYSSMQPQIESGVKSAGVANRGLDTGGYGTAMAKAKASTWQDMLKQIIGQQNTSNTLGEQKRQFDVTQSNLKSDQADQYRLLTEQLKTSQPSGWDYILGGAGAGSALGPWGALGGALLGWGKKQGLFGD